MSGTRERARRRSSCGRRARGCRDRGARAVAPDTAIPEDLTAGVLLGAGGSVDHDALAGPGRPDRGSAPRSGPVIDLERVVLLGG